jgi:hypothetical protein
MGVALHVLKEAHMQEKSPDFDPESVWLTRSEAARYVGVSGESAIRSAEDRGLTAATDAAGQAWHSPATLDAWKWRGKAPSAKQKARVLREAHRARQHEARERQRKEDAEAERELAEWDAQLKQFDQEHALRDSVRQKAREQREAFEHAHMDERTAGMALGFPSHEARYRVRDLVNRGHLRRVEGPGEPRVEVSFDGAREVVSSWPLCSGGPFIPREDVLRLKQEMAEAAALSPQQAVSVHRAPSLDPILVLLVAGLAAGASRRRAR